jgi:hypothetical protein
VPCVYGFQVSREAVAELRRRGVDARPLSGGWPRNRSACSALKRKSP